MRDELGLNFTVPTLSAEDERRWDDYTTLRNPPEVRAEGTVGASSIYKGIVPARNIFRRDFAVNGASVCLMHPGYDAVKETVLMSLLHYSSQQTWATYVKSKPTGSPPISSKIPS